MRSEERGMGILENLPPFAFLKVIHAVQDGNKDRLAVLESDFIEFGQKSLATFLSGLRIMREEVAAIQIALWRAYVPHAEPA
jgi:hypothetical protein